MCATVSVKGLFGAVPSPRGRGAPPGGQGTAGRPRKAGGEGHVGRPVTTPCQKRNRRLQFALSLRELSAARWEYLLLGTDKSHLALTEEDDDGLNDDDDIENLVSPG